MLVRLQKYLSENKGLRIAVLFFYFYFFFILWFVLVKQRKVQVLGAINRENGSDIL